MTFFVVRSIDADHMRSSFYTSNCSWPTSPLACGTARLTQLQRLMCTSRTTSEISSSPTSIEHLASVSTRRFAEAEQEEERQQQGQPSFSKRDCTQQSFEDHFPPRPPRPPAPERRLILPVVIDTDRSKLLSTCHVPIGLQSLDRYFFHAASISGMHAGQFVDDVALSFTVLRIWPSTVDTRIALLQTSDAAVLVDLVRWQTWRRYAA
ncbi:hypothetical protein V8E36_008797 [Tilletia maclaganii]